MKKILVLGGTQMLGRDFVEHCLNDKDINITVANRLITNPNLFKNRCSQIKINRADSKLCENLSGAKYDVVVDFSCYNVDHFLNTMKHLRYDQYLLISTISARDNVILKNKNSPLHQYAIDKKSVEDYIYSNYTLRKSITIVRPCAVYGKYDYTGRFVEIGNQFYHSNTNQKVVNNGYYISVKDLTNKLIETIDKKKKGTIYVDGGGYNIFPEENKNIVISKYNVPFNHIVIDNLFDESTYNSMCKIYPDFISRTKPYKDLPGATSDYEAYITGFGYDELIKNAGYELFASKYLQNFVESSFNIKTNEFIAPSAHYHKAPSKDGFVHNDYNIVCFGQRGAEFTCTGHTDYCNDLDEENIDVNKSKVVRSIALLYYLNNDVGKNSIGGGTGIFDSHHRLVKSIEPKNNRLFMFEINTNTYHAFIGANFDRSTIVSWFHSDVAYHAHRNWKNYNYGKGIERWRGGNQKMWPIQKDPDYKLYFDNKGNPL